VQVHKIPYALTGEFSQLVTDYLSDAEPLAPFYKYRPGLSAIEQVIADKEEVDRGTLIQVLTDQYKDLPENKVSSNQIKRLADSNTYTVTTAHQPVLFGGPMYSILKVLGVISFADQLNTAYPNYHFVPVYMMGTEDHDFEELGHISLYGNRIDWEDQTASAVGRMDCGSMDSAIDAFAQIAGTSEHASSLLELIRSTYIAGRSMAQASQRLMHQLLGHTGLIVIDPDDARLKSLCKDILKDELTNRSAEKLVGETSKLLAETYHAQTNAMPINLFYMDDKIRERIVPDGEKLIGNRSGVEYELSQLLDTPDALSPNVIIRGLMQEKVLPNLAYLGGGAEVAYWMQYRALFEHHGVNFPMILLRNSVMFLTNSQHEIGERLGLHAADFFRPSDKLIKEFVGEQEDISLSNEIEAIQHAYDALVERLIAADKGLEQTAAAAKQKARNDLEKLEDKLVKSAKRRHETDVNKIKRLKDTLFPNNHLQERSESFLFWYLYFGPDFIDQLANFVDPLVFEFQVIADD
jgi:bacillithiol biosynthesis cysteine-adding enzyme BshC